MWTNKDICVFEASTFEHGTNCENCLELFVYWLPISCSITYFAKRKSNDIHTKDFCEAQKNAPLNSQISWKCFLKFPYLNNRFQQVTKILQDFFILHFPSLNCNQIWLIPLVDDSHCGYITIIEKKTSPSCNHNQKHLRSWQLCLHGAKKEAPMTSNIGKQKGTRDLGF